MKMLKTVIFALTLALIGFTGVALAEDESRQDQKGLRPNVLEKQELSSEQRVEKGRLALLKHIERIEDKLDRLADKVNRMQMLDEDSKEELLDLLDEKRTILSNIENDVNDADTPADLMVARADLRAFIRDLQEDWRAKLKEIRNQNFDELLEKTKDRLEEMRERVEDAEDEGDDVKNAGHYLDHCESDIERAERHQDAGNLKAAASNLKHCYHDFRIVLRILGGEPVEALPEGEDSSS